MTTLAITQHHNPQSLAWAVAATLWAILRTLLIILVGAALFAGVIALVVAVVGAIPWQLYLGAAIITLYAVATYPRKAVRS